VNSNCGDDPRDGPANTTADAANPSGCTSRATWRTRRSPPAPAGLLCNAAHRVAARTQRAQSTGPCSELGTACTSVYGQP
jgi:hypothetical protein